MSKIDRYDGDLKAFGADSVSTERTVFGDVTQSNTLDDNLNADFFRGWGIIGVNDFPPIEWFNAIGFTATQILAYLHQMGVAEWNTNQEYHNGSVCIDGAGKVYISKTDNNDGNALPANEDANWKRVLDFSDLNNTALTGVPTAPTAPAGTATTQLATTEFTRVKWQRKNLLSNSTSAGVISALTFTGLTIGRTYRCNLKAWISITESSMSVQVLHDGSIISAAAFSASDSSGSVNSTGLASFSDVVVFEATATTLEFNQSAGSGTVLVAGNADGWFTHVILEELPNHEEVAIW